MIVVDSREAVTKTAQQIMKLVPTEIQTLEVGDYISGNVLIERMSLTDFLGKVKNGRLWEQLQKLSTVENLEKRIIIEGSLGLIHKLKLGWKENQLFGIIEAILSKFDIHVLNFSSSYWTVKYILYLNIRTGGKTSKEIRFQKPSETIRDEQLYLVAGLPNINYERAKDLLEYFKTPRRLFSAQKEEFMRVRGIGEKIASKIIEVLDTEFS